VRIVENPFQDIVPRITAAEKRAQQVAREQALKEREVEQRSRGGKKNVKLLSFGADEGAEEEAPRIVKKAIVRPDLIDDSSSLAIPVPAPPPKTKAKEQSKETSGTPQPPPGKAKAAAPDISSIRTTHAKEQSAESAARAAEIARMEADIRKIARRRAGSASDDSEDERAKKKLKGPSALTQELAKYEKGRGRRAPVRGGDAPRRKDESDVLAALESFRGKLQRAPEAAGTDDVHAAADSMDVADDDGEVEEGIEVDDDFGWLGHALHFAKDDSEVGKAERDYEVIDPRIRSERAREEERERKRQRKSNVAPSFRQGRR